MRVIKINKFGLAENPIGLQVSMPLKGKELLGDVVWVEHNEMRGMTSLVVHHFNGQTWPIKPNIGSVRVI